jgi:hypothetical protein
MGPTLREKDLVCSPLRPLLNSRGKTGGCFVTHVNPKTEGDDDIIDLINLPPPG